jgi:hypothetical protein
MVLKSVVPKARGSGEEPETPRPGYSILRLAPRVPGGEWEIEIASSEGQYRVLNVSRMGICLEGMRPMRVDGRYSVRLIGPAGPAVLDFTVLRCTMVRDADIGEPVYRIAGVFAATLERDDLPEDS